MKNQLIFGAQCPCSLFDSIDFPSDLLALHSAFLTKVVDEGGSNQEGGLAFAVKKSDIKMSLISLYFTFYHFFSDRELKSGKETVKFLAIFDHQQCQIEIKEPARSLNRDFALWNLVPRY
jgi:hypothetical protein